MNKPRLERNFDLRAKWSMTKESLKSEFDCVFSGKREIRAKVHRSLPTVALDTVGFRCRWGNFWSFFSKHRGFVTNFVKNYGKNLVSKVKTTKKQNKDL